MSFFYRNPERRATKLLLPVFPDAFNVTYDPAFPRFPRGTFALFQVVFAVGPGDDSSVRAQVHQCFERTLRVISVIPALRKADCIALRARRRVPDDPLCKPHHPIMFIEATWPGTAIDAMRKNGNF